MPPADPSHDQGRESDAAFSEEELAELERKARAATKAKPGRWKLFSSCKMLAIFRGREATTSNCVVNWPGFDQLNDSWPTRTACATHIAAFDPPTVLRLLAEVRAGRGAKGDLATCVSELATDSINQLFDEIDPQTHEEISFAVYDAVMAALASRARPVAEQAPRHLSDCARHNGPALPPEHCDCATGRDALRRLSAQDDDATDALCGLYERIMRLERALVRPVADGAVSHD